MHFTSGTTGRPKGVWSGLLSPDDAEALVREERDLWGFRPDDVDLVVSPIYHSAPLRFAMGTLLAGGSIVVLPRFEPESFVAAVHDVRPTSMFCVPAHLQRLFAWLDETGTTLDPSSFRLVAHAGAPCPDPIRRRAHELFGLDVVWEFYGSTEGQFTACPAPLWVEHPGTLGPARPGRVVTADDDDQLWCAVPPWAAFTYWRDPEKTAAAWKDTADGPAFTVGDLGRVEDGLVWLDSRRSDLVISGGVNVYPAEVEAALADAPASTTSPSSVVPTSGGASACARPTSATWTRRCCATSRASASHRPSDPRSTSGSTSCRAPRPARSGGTTSRSRPRARLPTSSSTQVNVLR